MRKIRVRYTVQFETIIDVDDDISDDEAIQDIDIPENQSTHYVEDSFEVNSSEVVDE